MDRDRIFIGCVLVALAVLVTAAPATAQCQRSISADVVALDQPYSWNRLGAVQPQGMIFALARDVYPDATLSEIPPNSCEQVGCTPGSVHLRRNKRPRPLVLRMNVGDCLSINFQNLLNPVREHGEQVATRDASIHVVGLQPVASITDDGSNVGDNGAGGSGVVPPGGHATYTLYAEREGQHVLYSTGADTGGEGNAGQIPEGLFGAVNVEPAGSMWYRSQVTGKDVEYATKETTSDGHPLLDYGKRYSDGTPVFEMLDAGKIVHSDLTAIIAGPFSATYPLNPTYPDRGQSFREFTIIYHDEVGAVQAFPAFFKDPILAHTLHSVRDAFAINYGTGGVGSEILANRLGVGPMRDCVTCKYEEFFLSSWTVGDPAMVVDKPANACVGAKNCRATQAFYPDDPSNVYHSYLWDHTKFRILHGGGREHHIHHQHAHQWLYAPDSDESAYLDSQAIGPGASFTLEMTYNGSGNKNLTVGDSIFHCHFYPHFAQGMWAMWRVHDVFENGNRMLPDGEIAQGTPIPGVVPIPGQAMAPMPGATVTIAPDSRLPAFGGQVKINGVFVRDMLPGTAVGNPGYPFFVPGIAGERPPHPPLDTIDDGGLPRHLVTSGVAAAVQTRLDFTKETLVASAYELDENGVPVEDAAMSFHEERAHESFTPEGVDAKFYTNGAPRVAGAPYAEPCIDINGNPAGGSVDADGRVIPARTYKAANIQLDVIFNKSGWHFPQQRILTLWGDVAPTFAGERPPEPFFFRANSDECIEYQHTNLVPNVYELDDFQVRTPTDILGQHIHLVKFDVTSSDGSANGWNYEDGTYSPDEVREIIHAINAGGGLLGLNGTHRELVPKEHPYFGAGPGGKFLGAQTTVQRWYADPVLNNQHVDRTMRTVFTHDHYGPSTHQQAGLYAGLVIEPAGSQWRDPESGVIFGGRFDGGPTSWRADILDGEDSHREFLFEFADFQLAYEENSHPGLPNGYGRGPVFQNEWAGAPGGQQPGNGSGVGVPGKGFDNADLVINPPGKVEVGLPFLLRKPVQCPVRIDPESPVDPVPPAPPCPEAISSADVGTMVTNYRNEPLALRVHNPSTNKQATGDKGDLALAFASILRQDPDLNVQPTFYPPLTGNVGDYDPFTPLLQAFEHDQVQIRTLVGAHEEGHNMSVNGIKWLFEPLWKNSGFKNSQMMGISEHFEFLVPQLVKNPIGNQFDYLWANGAATDDLWNGLWGLFRVYRNSSTAIQRLPNNPNGGREIAPGEAGRFDGVCPKTAPVTSFSVTAGKAQQFLSGPLVYNQRIGPDGYGPLIDPTAIMYVRTTDLDANGRLLPGVPIEPLVLRARAGDCIQMTLKNAISPYAFFVDYPGFSTLPMIVDDFNNNQIRESQKIGLHPQLVHYDISRSDGNNVGTNPIQTANPGQTVTYTWYAGDQYVDVNGIVQATPVEFGATNLIPADRVKQPSKGAIGALIIEPQGATWTEDSDLSTCGQKEQPRCSRASATVNVGLKSFREFVLLFQDDVNLRCTGCGDAADGDVNAVPNIAEAEDPEDSGQKALNYRTEPMWFRFGFQPDAPLTFTRDLVLTDILTNAQVGGDPETPVFMAGAGQQVRFRVLEPGGHARNHVFNLHGHVWQQEPYVSTLSFPRGPVSIGNNPLSMWEGARMGHGPTNHFDAVLQNGAGGKFQVPGDYLYRDHASFLFDSGLWGLLRVVPFLAP